MKLKQLLFTILIGLSFNLSAQVNNFEYTKNGLEPKYIVIDAPEKLQNELYSTTINWINDTYKNPDEVIKSKIENNKVRFEGVNKNDTSLGMLKYTIEVSFKDGRIKFEPINLQIYIKPTQYIKIGTGWQNLSLDLCEDCYNRKGELRKFGKEKTTEIPLLFNSLIDNLKNYILSGQDNTKNQDW